jgi:hypothetical protein
MSDRKKAYEHESSLTGTRGDDTNPATEHQDTASGDATRRNEIDARRGEPTDQGPSTSSDTRIDRAGE